MGAFNYIGLIIIVVMMIPNLIYMFVNRNTNVQVYTDKKLDTLEQIGRYGCFACMIVNFPYTYFDFWFKNAELIYIIVCAVLLACYLLCWIIFWKKTTMFKVLALSVLPSMMFLFTGIMLGSLLLLFFTLVFAPTHFIIGYRTIKLNQSI